MVIAPSAVVVGEKELAYDLTHKPAKLMQPPMRPYFNPEPTEPGHDQDPAGANTSGAAPG